MVDNDVPGKDASSSQKAPKQHDARNTATQRSLKRSLKINLLVIGLIVGAGALWYFRPSWFSIMSSKHQVASATTATPLQPTQTPSRQGATAVQQPTTALATMTQPNTVYQEKILLAYLSTLTDALAFELQYHHRPQIIRALANRIQMQTLQLSRNPAFIPLQARVNTLLPHVHALPSLTPLNTVTLFTNLHDRVAELNLNLYPLKNFKDNSEEEAEKSLTWYQKILDKMSTLVIIRHHENHVEPLLSPTQNFYLKINLQLIITQTEIAFQTENWSFALHNLSTIRDNLQNYFDLTTEDGKQALQILGQLESLAHSMANDHHDLILQDLVKINELVEMKLNEN